MITEWLLDLCVTVVTWFTGMFGDAEVPDWLLGVTGWIGDLLESAAGLGAWVNFPLVAAVAAAVFGTWLVLWLVKALRWLWGLTPLSGGS